VVIVYGYWNHKKGPLKLKGVKDVRLSDIDYEKNITKFIVLCKDSLKEEEILENIKETGKLVGKPYRGKITGVKDVK
jgi:hypothetical protein